VSRDNKQCPGKTEDTDWIADHIKAKMKRDGMGVANPK
jgi:hypothetical protein